MIRVGCGFDVHPFKSGRKLILGGADIPHDSGLDGHSDADVLTHAVIDALLGGIGKGDIGERFPDDDPQYKDANSIDLLREVAADARFDRVVIMSIDVSIALEKPHLAKYRDEMRENLSKATKVPKRRISVKATTCEKLGFVGRGEGAAAFAVILLNDNKPIGAFYTDEESDEEDE
ncbi:MAG: 2-C-methyl-D-erythritol 2,4-cyclodiphosphate synthase [Gammaproteobacteria bacterium]